MAVIRHVATLLGPSGGVFTRNLTDLEFTRTPAGLVLAGVTQFGGGLSSWRVSAAGTAAAAVAQRAYAGASHRAEPDAVLMDGAGGRLALSLGLGGGAQRLQLSDSGALSTPAAGAWAGLPTDALTATRVVIGGQGYVLAARGQNATFQSWREGPNGLTQVGSTVMPLPVHPGARIDDIATASVGGSTFALSVSTMGNFVAIHRLGGDGRPEVGKVLGMSATTPFASPREVETVSIAGATFAIVSGGESSSLTVLRVTAAGDLVAVDHVLDEGGTRFARATELETVTVNGRAFVFAAGADHGISMFVLLPNGQLVHLGAVADTAATALQRVSALAAESIGGRIALAAASATEAGLTQFEVNPGPIGLTGWAAAGNAVGSGANDLLLAQDATNRIEGGAGDDILAAFRRPVTLVGGPGSDLFIPAEVRGTITIADFNPQQDRLDLSNLGAVRSTYQLTITPTGTGLTMRYGASVIDLRSHNGTTLQPSLIVNEMFPLAHYAAPGTATVIGTARADLIAATINATTAYGLSGNDTLHGSYLADELNGGDGNDQLAGRGGNDSLFGGAGADLLMGETGQDTLTGGEGNDTLRGGAGNDRLAGGNGDDVLDGEDGDDMLIAEAGHDRLYGAAGNDSLSGGAGNNLLNGGAGDDYIADTAGLNTLSGGAGDDTLLGGALADTINGEGGSDLLLGRGGADLLLGHDGVDRIQGGDGDDTAQGGNGNDSLSGDGGDDHLAGDAGNDWLGGGDGGDTLLGGDGDDLALGGAGDDLLGGGAGADVLRGGEGNDRLHAGAGDDHLYGEGGDDLLYGEADRNLLDGGAGRDTIYGSALADTLLGDLGDDSLSGGGGDDFLDGGQGNDTLGGGAGNDRLLGGEGDDRLLGGDGDDSLWGGPGVNYLHGGAGQDRLQGDALSDTLVGDAGNDLMLGGGGRDLLSGGVGNDTLWGGADADNLTGGDGADLLIGEAGADTLAGGTGADVFRFVTRQDAGTGAGADVIADFAAGIDRLDLRALGLSWIGRDGFDGRAGQLRQQTTAEGSLLLADFDGDGRADLQIRMIGAVAGANDLLL